MSEEKCRLCTKLKSDHFEVSTVYAFWKYCDDPTDIDLWYKNACRKFEQSQEPVPTAMTEPIEKITEKTRVGEVCSDSCIPERGYHLNHIGVGTEDIDEPYRTALLTSAEKDAKIKELEEKLKEAVKVFETCSNAMSRQVSIRDENRLGWAFKEVVEFLEKLKAE